MQFLHIFSIKNIHHQVNWFRDARKIFCWKKFVFISVHTIYTKLLFKKRRLNTVIQGSGQRKSTRNCQFYIIKNRLGIKHFSAGKSLHVIPFQPINVLEVRWTVIAFPSFNIAVFLFVLILILCALGIDPSTVILLLWNSNITVSHYHLNLNKQLVNLTIDL